MRKISKVTAALLLGATLSLYAADATVDTGAGVTVGASIDAQIEEIKNANPDQRRELMNRFKEELANMNREERMEAISKLRESMHALNGEQMAEHAGEHAGEHAQKGMEHMEENMHNMKDMANRQQSMQMQHAGEMEQMHQRQGMDQYRDSGSMNMGGGASGHTGGSEMPFGGHRR